MIWNAIRFLISRWTAIRFDKFYDKLEKEEFKRLNRELKRQEKNHVECNVRNDSPKRN